MKANLLIFASGLLFALGLGLAGMTDATKVIGFLDIAGNWDPSLAFVMAGAIAVHMVAYRLVPRMQQPLAAQVFGIPTRRDFDPRLVGGAALFGTGWALGGFCPGPGLTAMMSGDTAVFVFVAAMTGGMVLFHQVETAMRRPAKQPELDIVTDLPGPRGT